MPNGGVDAFGSAYARNDGTITTTGGHGKDLDTSSRRFRVWHKRGLLLLAMAQSINNAGDVEAINTGTITVSGPGARGIQANTLWHRHGHRYGRWRHGDGEPRLCERR